MTDLSDDCRYLYRNGAVNDTEVPAPGNGLRIPLQVIQAVEVINKWAAA
jgi:hypothetical protein